MHKFSIIPSITLVVCTVGLLPDVKSQDQDQGHGMGRGKGQGKGQGKDLGKVSHIIFYSMIAKDNVLIGFVVVLYDST